MGAGRRLRREGCRSFSSAGTWRRTRRRSACAAPRDDSAGPSRTPRTAPRSWTARRGEDERRADRDGDGPRGELPRHRPARASSASTPVDRHRNGTPPPVSSGAALVAANEASSPAAARQRLRLASAGDRVFSVFALSERATTGRNADRDAPTFSALHETTTVEQVPWAFPCTMPSRGERGTQRRKPRKRKDLGKVAAPTGFEPATSGLKGRRPDR